MINEGKKCYNPNLKYPLRKLYLIDDEVNDIIQLIKNTSLSLREIARRYNVSPSTVIGINSGRYHHNDNLKYPIRETS